MEASPLAPAPIENPDSTVPFLDYLTLRAAQLYSLPAVAAQVLQLTGSGEMDRLALKACLENDPALTTRILKVVNSSLFGLTRKVTDLGQALALLGVKPLKMLVLGFSLPSQLVADMEKEVLTDYWRHTLLKTAGCRELCRRLCPARSEEAITAGLLQDVGELALIQQLGQPYVRFRSQVRKEQRPLRETESLALGFDHVELSARLLNQWGMPESFTDLIAARSSEVGDADRPLVKILQVAEVMARVVESGGIDSVGLAAVPAELGLMAEDIQEILAVLTQRAEELAHILSLDLPARADLATVAHVRLAETSAELLEGACEASLLAEVSLLQSQMQTAARLPLPQNLASPRMHAAQKPRQTAGPSPSAEEQFPLSSDSPLLGNIAAAMARCREQKRSLSLVLFQVHNVLAGGSVREAYPSPQRLLAALERWSQDRGSGLTLPQNNFALLWEGCNRSDGFELARLVVRLGQESSHAKGGALAEGWMLSAGLATLALPPRNFPPQELIASAQRCLAAALHSGGGAVKSIEY